MTYFETAWAWLGELPALGLYLVLAWLAYVLGLSLWIILQKREPVATLSWVMSLALLPYVGFLIYFLLGPQKIQRQRLRRGRSRSGLEQFSAPNGDKPECLELARLGQATTGLPPSSATSAQWLVDGHAKYEALLSAIADARHHVHLEYYIWAPDKTGLRLRDALVDRAREGIQVRLLLDAVGAGGMRRRHLRPLLDAGAEQAIGDIAAVASLLLMAFGHLAREAQPEQRRFVVREADIGDARRLEAGVTAARLQPRMAGAQRGVSGKRQLAPRAEDAHAVVGPGRAAFGGGRQHKGGFREVGPVRELLHRLGGQARAVQHHGQGVATVGGGGEHIDLLEGAVVHGLSWLR